LNGEEPDNQKDKNMKINWTPIEDAAVMAQYHILRTKQPILTQAECYIRAQIVLPEERRRKNAWSAMVWEFNKRYQNKNASGHPHEFPAGYGPTVGGCRHETAPQVAPQVAPIESKQPAEAAPRVVVVEKLPDFGRISDATLFQITFERLGKLLTRFENLEALGDKLAEVAKVLNAPNGEPKVPEYDHRLDTRPLAARPPIPVEERAIRICIVGLLPAQQHEVENKTQSVSKPIKLRFLDADALGEQLPTVIDHIICSRFVSHSMNDKCKSAVPKGCFHYIDGGLGAIVQKIYDISAKQ